MHHSKSRQGNLFPYLLTALLLLSQQPSSVEAADRSPTSSTATSTGNTSSNTPSSPCCAKLHAFNFSSNIPVIVVELEDLTQAPGTGPVVTTAAAQLLAKGPALPATLCTCGAPDSLDVASVPVHIKVRGSSSAAQYAKKSFALKTLNQNTKLSTAKGENIKLLGLPSDSSWVLHGPENDRTLGMRNWLAYWTARQMGRYASRTVYFEMFLNTAAGTPLSLQHYRGVYQLQEKVSRGAHRVNVAKFDPTKDVSGGYIFSYQNDNIEAKDVTTQLRLTQLVMIIDYPGLGGSGDANQQVIMWITQWFNNFESSLLSKNVSGLSDVLDVPAAIDYFIGTEVTKNPDGYRGSIYMHKDRGGPLVLGPMWDYNEAFGMCCGYPIEGHQSGGVSNGTSGGSAVSAAGWRFNICQDKGRCKVEPGDGIAQWYRKLWMDPLFRSSAARRWNELRRAGGPLADDAFKLEIANNKDLLKQGPAARNYQRWSTALNNPNYGPSYPDWQTMFDDEVRILQDWILAHLKWLDAAFAAEADPSAAPDAYMSVGYVTAEPELAGADNLMGPVDAPAAAAAVGASMGAAPQQVVAPGVASG